MSPGTRENKGRVSIATAAFLQWGQGRDSRSIAIASKVPKSPCSVESDRKIHTNAGDAMCVSFVEGGLDEGQIASHLKLGHR
jgi:hypothetical protein